MIKVINLKTFIFFLSFFPWVSFGLLKTDTQPYTLVLIILSIVINPQILRPTKFLIFTIINILLGMFICLLNTSNLFSFISFRFTYGALLIIFGLIFYCDFLLRYGYPRKVIISANLIYLLVALVEAYNPSLLSFLAVSRTDFSRGVTSLTPEPSYFGSFLFFCSLSLYIESGFNFKKDFKIHILNLLFIIFLAKSSLATLLLVLCTFIFFLFQWSIKKVFTIFFPAFLLTNFIPTIVEQLLPNTRIGKIFDDLYKVSLYDLFYIDQSFNQRLEHLVISLHASYKSFFIPNGVDKFIDKRFLILPHYDGYFWYADETNIIMSWVGDFIFHFGIFGILFILAIFIYVNLAKKRIYLAALVVLFITLLTPIPIAFPLTYLIFSQLIVKSSQSSIT